MRCQWKTKLSLSPIELVVLNQSCLETRDNPEGRIAALIRERPGKTPLASSALGMMDPEEESTASALAT